MDVELTGTAFGEETLVAFDLLKNHADMILFRVNFQFQYTTEEKNVFKV